MTVIAFDTLKYADRLEAGGFSAQQAKAEAQALAEVLSTPEVVNIRDLERIEQKIEQLRSDMTSQNALLRSDFNVLRSDLNGKFTLLQWMLGLLLAGVASLVIKSFF